jgi:hypothetical protein
MLGTLPIRKYFSTGTSHYITPSVSAEWNYNLFYPTYTSFAGDGTDYSSNVGSWSNPPSTQIAGGKHGVNCLKFTLSGNNASSQTTVTVPEQQGTYKIVFYAKVLEDQEVTLTSLTYIDSHRSSSESKSIDSTQWTKFETYISSRPIDTAFSSFTWTLDYTAKDSNVSNTYVQGGNGLYYTVPSGANTTCHILIDMIRIYKTTSFDYQYGNLWPTDSPFTFFRPGESYVPSGNALTPLPADFRKISTKINSNKTWSNQMPCSPIVFNPNLLASADSNPLFKNGILSDYSKYKYFVSDSSSKYLGAVYENKLNINKIVLKFNLSTCTPNLYLSLYNGEANINNISISSASISDAGVCILYLQQNGSWSTTPWSAMPAFNTQGQIKFEGTSTTSYVQIDKIILNQTSETLNSNYSASSIAAKTDMKRMQVIEISPRLELDLSYFTMSVATVAELDNKENPLPISAISSNHASLQLSNVPLTVSNQPLSLFSNNSTNSPLKGLFKKNVKFYINYVVRDAVVGTSSSEKVIPNGIYYAESWNGQDIQKTEVSLFDISKQLQLRSPSDYVSESQDIFKTITNILDMAGFTDYDYDTLYKVTKAKTTLSDGTTTTNTHPIIAQYFYADGQQQKIFDVLREIFEVYQIGAYIDSYGVMKFLNLNDILNNKTPNLVLHDSGSEVNIVDPKYGQIIPVTSNIVQDTYTENVKIKVGQATIKYRIPQINKSLSPATNNNTDLLLTSIIDKNDVLWTLDKDDATTFNYLDESISTVSQNYFKINKSDLLKTFNSFSVNHNGYAIIEGEIVSFKDKEYYFSITPSSLSPSKTITDYRVNISDESDLKRAISEYSALSGYGGAVSYEPTGKIVNVERGLFNTPVRTHKVIKTVSDLQTKMQTYGSGIYPSIYENKIKLEARSGFGKNVLIPIGETNSNTINYNTFSTKMYIGPNVPDALYTDGVGGGIVLNAGSANPIYIEIRQDLVNSKVVGSKTKTKTHPGYRLYVYKGSEPNTTTSLFKSQTYYDVYPSLLNDVSSYPSGSPFEEFGKTVNLKFVKTSSSTFEIYLNKNRLNLDLKEGISLDVSGIFGIFSNSSITGKSGGVVFSELYATQTALTDPSIYYHYELPSFANTIVGGHKVFETNYMFQTSPQVVGIQYYDVQYSLAPSINAYPLKVNYGWWYFTDPVDGQVILNAVRVGEDALNYSYVYNSGFRGRIAIINGSPASVWLKKSPDSKNGVDINFLINSDNVITLSEEQSITKVFDQSNISDSIEIRSNWVQSKDAASGILNTVFKAIDGFSRDTSLSVYGNPLFEIGDVVTVNYSLKNIINQTYFVQGVEQTFDQGLKTVLVLNQIA